MRSVGRCEFQVFEVSFGTELRDKSQVSFGSGCGQFQAQTLKLGRRAASCCHRARAFWEVQKISGNKGQTEVVLVGSLCCFLLHSIHNNNEHLRTFKEPPVCPPHMNHRGA